MKGEEGEERRETQRWMRERRNGERRKRREEDGRASLGMDEKEEKRTRWMKGGKKLMGQITN